MLTLLLACATDLPKDPADTTPTPVDPPAPTAPSETTPADDDPVEVDADGDGALLEDDCDDADPTVHPGALERCDDIDQACDGGDDEGAVHIEAGDAYASITDALTSAVDGDTIVVCPGVYAEHLRIHQAVTVRSRDGAEVTHVDGGGVDRVVMIDVDGVVLEGLTLENGLTPPYGEFGGGGIYLAPGLSLTMRASDVVRNVGYGPGGGIYVDIGGSLVLEDTIVRENTCSSSGCGVALDEGASLVGGVLADNLGHAIVGGLALSMLTGASARGVEMYGNQGGAVRTFGDGISLLDCDIHENEWQSTVIIQYGTADLTGTVIHDNEVGVQPPNIGTAVGGGVYLMEVATIIGGEVRGNVAGYGGGVYVGARGDIEGTLIVENHATFGGGIYVEGGTSPTLSGVTLQANEADEAGGGAFLSSSFGNGALDSVGSDWGTGGTDNLPDDVASEQFSAVGYALQDFACTVDGGCSP